MNNLETMTTIATNPSLMAALDAAQSPAAKAAIFSRAGIAIGANLAPAKPIAGSARSHRDPAWTAKLDQVQVVSAAMLLVGSD